MAISEQRLALFALLSEFEADSREIIEFHICPDHSIDNDIGAEAFSSIIQRAARSNASSEINDHTLLNYLDIGDVIKILLSNRSILPTKISAALNKQARLLEGLPAIRNRVMHRRPLEFDDLPLATDLLRSLAKADKNLFARTVAAFEAISTGRAFSSYAPNFEYDGLPAILNNLPQADFDDTGFLGRREQIEDLKKAIAGPFPVITVLGVGGAGKSALALHVAYDILNDPDSEFDAVIWTSAKTTRLTGTDVQEIVGAISSSVGIAEAALHELGAASGDDPFNTVRELLESFKILLFIDNLETILDERVRAFVRDIPSGSKVVFTSRIGLGAYDFVIPVSNLDPKQSSVYYRRVASVWKQFDLASASKEDISSHCVRLNHSPLGIKWFIQAVASGAVPQRLLSNPKELLSFCLENIVSNLSGYAKDLLSVLAITGREQSPASLHYIADIDTWNIEDALRELIASNLITVIVSKFGEEDRYKISPLAQTYISRLHPPSASFQTDVRKKQAQLTALSERAEADGGRDFVFDPAFLFVRREFSGTDSVAATYLRRARLACRVEDWDVAFAEIDRAKEIAPSYFEVLRVEAQVAALEGNTLRAQSAFEEAMALKPDYPPLSVWYSDFLIKALGNGAEAESILKSALTVDSSSVDVKMELARCLLYQLKFQDCWDNLQDIDRGNIKSSRSLRKFYDILIQSCTRSSEVYLEKGDSDNFMVSFSRLRSVIGEIPTHVIDDQVERHLRKAVFFGRKFISGEGSQSPRSIEIGRNIDSICSVIRDQDHNIPDTGKNSPRLSGRICNMPVGKSFGFIDGDDGQRLFFHRNHLKNRIEFEIMAVGMPVSYDIGSNAAGICAEQVTLII